MSKRWPPGRRVRRLARFDRELGEIERHGDRAREALEGLESVLARMPDEAGMAVPGEPEWRQRPIHVGDRTYSVLYTFDDDAVLLLSLRQVASGQFE